MNETRRRTTPNLPNLLTPKEVQEYLHIGNNTLYNLLSQKDFPSFRLGKRYYIFEDKFLEWMDMKSKKFFRK